MRWDARTQQYRSMNAALRALMRIEWRDQCRHPQRTALILLLIALPVAAITAGGLLARIIEPTPAERAAATLGEADLRIDEITTFAAQQAARAALPPSARVERIFEGGDDVYTPGRRLRAAALAVEPPTVGVEPLFVGMLRLTTGHLPTNVGEVALSQTLLDAAECRVGDEVALTYGASRRITGIVCDPENLDAAIVLRTLAHVENQGAYSLLVKIDGRDVGETAAELRQHRFHVTTRAEAALGDEFTIGAVFALGCIACFQAALVVSAAFAIGLRRRQYEIGLLGSIGASPGSIASTITGTAGLLGLAGSLGGAVLGIIAANLLSPHLDTWNRRLNGDFEISTSIITAAIGLGVTTALLAACLPARQAARLPIRQALCGRRPPPPRTVGFVAIGGALLSLGVTATFASPAESSAATFLIAGPILCLIGIGVSSPWLLDFFAGRAARLPLRWRIAVRDAGRFRLRNGPVVTAVVAGMSLTVAAACFVASFERALDIFPAPYRDDQVLVAGPDASSVSAQLAREFSAIAAAPLLGTYLPDGQPVRVRFPTLAHSDARSGWLACGDEQLLAALGGAQARSAFTAGALISLIEAPSDRALLTAWLDGRRVAEVELVTAVSSQRIGQPHYIIHSSHVAALGLESGPPLNRSLTAWLLRLPDRVTHDTIERGRHFVANSPGVTLDAACLHAQPARPYFYGLLLLCGLAALTVVFVATALSAAESATDDRTLFAVGASPGVLRAQWATRASYLSLIGCILAVPVGFIIAYAVVKLASVPLTFVAPWRDLLLIVFGLPLVVYIATWLIAARATQEVGSVSVR